MRDVVALHGFAGTGRMWGPVAQRLGAGWRLRAPDLPGHGQAAAQPATFARCVEVALRGAPERFVLVGYSMGGRVALHVALAAPERVHALVLVATTAGVDDREQRRAADEALAAEVERGSIEDFVARWTAQPLFAGDPPEAVDRWVADIRRNAPAGLAAALRGLGAGAMEPLWERLGELTMPAVVLAGERDAKYRELGERLVRALPAAEPLRIAPRAGHGLPREAPDAVARAIVAAASFP